MNKYVKIAISLAAIGVTGTVAVHLYKKWKNKGGTSVPGDTSSGKPFGEVTDPGELKQLQQSAEEKIQKGEPLTNEEKQSMRPGAVMKTAGTTGNTSSPGILNNILGTTPTIPGGRAGATSYSASTDQTKYNTAYASATACKKPDYIDGAVFLLVEKTRIGADKFTKFDKIFDGCTKKIKGYRLARIHNATLTNKQQEQYQIVNTRPSPII